MKPQQQPSTSRRASPVTPAKLSEESDSRLSRFGSIAAATALSALMVGAPAMADLNRFEFEGGSEFGNGTAEQWGEADIEDKDFSKQDLRRSNFTAANARRAKFMGANLQGAYFIKGILYKADFTDANLSDVLMDRAVLNDANLTNANLSRAVLTRSDLTGATVEGADFTNALVDRAQQIALCRYANGINPVTGESTRKSLGCGSSRRFKAQSPSSLDGPRVSEDEKEAFRATIPQYRQ